MPKLSPAERVWYQVADPLQGQAWLFWSPGICNSEHLDVWFRQSISSSRRTGRNTRDILLENIFLLDLSYKLNSQSNSKMAEVSSCYSQMKGHSLCQEIIYSTWKTRGGLKTRSICKIDYCDFIIVMDSLLGKHKYYICTSICYCLEFKQALELSRAVVLGSLISFLYV